MTARRATYKVMAEVPGREMTGDRRFRASCALLLHVRWSGAVALHFLMPIAQEAALARNGCPVPVC